MIDAQNEAEAANDVGQQIDPPVVPDNEFLPPPVKKLTQKVSFKRTIMKLD